MGTFPHLNQPLISLSLFPQSGLLCGSEPFGWHSFPFLVHSITFAFCMFTEHLCIFLTFLTYIPSHSTHPPFVIRTHRHLRWKHRGGIFRERCWGRSEAVYGILGGNPNPHPRADFRWVCGGEARSLWSAKSITSPESTQAGADD
jgi:hypothetical protein